MAKNELLFEVSSMFRTLLKSISQEWNKRDGNRLTFPQFKVMYMLDKLGPQKVSQLAEALSITSAAVTGITDKLLKEGLVRRERGEQDRRVVYITITDLGEETMRQVKESQKETIQLFFDVLPEEDIQHLRRIFAAMLSNIDNDNKTEVE